MKEVYVRKDELNSWITKYFKTDLISIDDLIATIEDLDGKVENLQEELEEIKNPEEEWRGNEYGE